MAIPSVVVPPLTVAAPPARRCAVVIEDRAVIPTWVDDLASFRRWVHSDAYPEHGQFAYLNGQVWVDLTMEELFTHNQVKAEFTAALVVLLHQITLGRFVADRMRLSHSTADLSVEPDGLFYTWSALQTGRLRLLAGTRGGIMELEGTPDMVLEIVSATSVNKDTVRLRELYWRAGIAEYWLTDVRGAAIQFEILRHTSTGYAVTPQSDGWQTSAVFGRAFRLTRSSDPLGHPQFRVEVGAAQPV